ncbi:hypothetical protein HY59_12445 [Raoultella ornithinolytica]|nr:hypothetical protein RORB6_05955 [Raoultella ornithinolytica B6]ANZ06144.1 hypothetical protein HY59_12445 [Raoultella ornithinolytica]
MLWLPVYTIKSCEQDPKDTQQATGAPFPIDELCMMLIVSVFATKPTIELPSDDDERKADLESSFPRPAFYVFLGLSNGTRKTP